MGLDTLVKIEEETGETTDEVSGWDSETSDVKYQLLQLTKYCRQIIDVLKSAEEEGKLVKLVAAMSPKQRDDFLAALNCLNRVGVFDLE